jgi:ketosteroid isomerase-like protein
MSDMAERAPVRDPQELAPAFVDRQRVGDVDGMVALYEPLAVFDCGAGRLAKGADAIRAFYAELIAEDRKFELGAQRPPIISGDLALTSTRLPNGAITVEVARRQRDGTWLWVIDMPSIA